MYIDDQGNQIFYQPLDMGGGFDWISSGASSPAPTAQPDFNSPVTQDSFGVLDQVTSGIDSLGRSLASVFGTATTVQNAAATSNASSQANQLRAQSQSTTMQVQRAQSTAAVSSAQANANIASAFAHFTGSPLVWMAVLAIVLYFVAKKLA